LAKCGRIVWRLLEHMVEHGTMRGGVDEVVEEERGRKRKKEEKRKKEKGKNEENRSGESGERNNDS
jgi:hypothetical protein